MYELLRRSPEVVFDAHIAHAGLIYDQPSARVLEQLTRTYIDIGISAGHALVVSTRAEGWS